MLGKDIEASQRKELQEETTDGRVLEEEPCITSPDPDDGCWLASAVISQAR